MARGADIVARTLEELGVSRILTLSGNHVMPLFDALLETKIDLVHTRHEAACVHMADAWGRLTGEAGIALVTGGQGHANAAAALTTAQAAESPVVLLSGHAALSELGRGAFQEMAQADLATPVTKASWTARAAATLGDDVATAVALATSGRKGPVHVSLPVDLLEQAIDSVPAGRRAADDRPARSGLDQDIAEAVRQAIGAARRPLVLCGPALCTERGREAMRFLEAALGAPVIGMESPRGVNDPGLGAFAEILAEADLLVLIGKRLDFTLRFGGTPAVSASCGFIVLDPEMEQISRVAGAFPERLQLWSVLEAESAVVGLSRVPDDYRRPDSSWRERVAEALAYEMPDWRTSRATAPDRLHPVELCRAVAAFVERHPGTTLVCDGGEIGQWPQALVRTDRRLINGPSGTIGVSLPFAIAAQFARPGEPVVAMVGDGAFGFHMAELDTALRYGCPVIVVVGNDARWNAEHQIQLRQYGGARARNCDLLPARYHRVAEALGGFGALVTSAADLGDALEHAYASGRPACINVMIESVAAPTIRR